MNNDRLTLALACAAEGTPTFVSMAIVQCSTTNGLSAPPVALPGPAAATAAVGEVPVAPYSVCVRAIGTDVNGAQHDTGLQCGGSTVSATA
jgi:hypothetical protein